MFLRVEKHGVSSPRFTTKPPQSHHQNTTFCTLLFTKTPAKTPLHHLKKNHAARAELVGRGAEVSELSHFGSSGQASGPDPERRSYNTFFSFEDPDGNGWLVQEVTRGADAG